MVKVSVIIPVFNVEKYLKECIESISNQSLKDIEIICIDDGSTDNSLNILNEYADNDSRFKIILQDNLGPGAARNEGISIAEGKYIYFMDSDDILELNALEDLYHLSEDKKTDFIFFKIINFDDETGQKTNRYYYDMPYSITNSFKEGYLDFLEMNRLLVEKVKELGKYEEFKDKLYHKKLYNIFDQFKALDEDSKPVVYEAFKNDLLNYKNQYESDNIFLNEIDERLRCIYYSCMYSENYREFELAVDNFDLNREVVKLKKINSKNLKAIAKLKKQIKEFESSNMYKLWNKISK